jgi:hypothetical protein
MQELKHNTLIKGKLCCESGKQSARLVLLGCSQLEQLLPARTPLSSKNISTQPEPANQ